jgi:acyl carrier protein
MRRAVFDIVRDAVGELNGELGYASLEVVTDETGLFGGDDGIDSLSLVSLIVDIEGRVGEAFGRAVVLADEKAMSARNSPYRSVGALVDFIVGRVQGGGGA